MSVYFHSGQVFLSTPSARRATPVRDEEEVKVAISIHALREEGDKCFFAKCHVNVISIHALREEGDDVYALIQSRLDDFYPRPPRGGRLQAQA